MPLVSGFTLRFFEFSIAVAVVDRSRVGPETNVYVGIARARTCERTTITMIDGRPCVVIFWFANRKTRASCKFQRALRSKKEETRSRRGPANCHRRGQLLMAPYLLDYPENRKSFLLLLCHYVRPFLLFIFFFLANVQLDTSSRLANSFSSVANDQCRFELVLRMIVDFALNYSSKKILNSV